MGLEHVNRRGDLYHLQSTSRGGRIHYSFTRKVPKEPVGQLPDGYEIYERPEDGQVFLRKHRPSPILPSEKDLVESAIRAAKATTDTIVRIEDDAIVIYLPDIEPEARLAFLAELMPYNRSNSDSLRRDMIRRAGYDKIFRFVLTDKNRREFTAYRWCFRGSIDDWIFLRADKPLPELLATYLPHLGKPSFFDLR